MDAGLFGEIVNKKHNGDTPRAEDSDEEESQEKEEEEKTASAWEELQEIVNGVVVLQNILGTVASLVERIEAMPKWLDPRISGLLSIIFLALVPGLYYVPLKLVMSFVVLFVLRHPALRDPIPPPPVSMVLRLPSRAELMLPREGSMAINSMLKTS
jgi:hypothetical protein